MQNAEINPTLGKHEQRHARDEHGAGKNLHEPFLERFELSSAAMCDAHAQTHGENKPKNNACPPLTETIPQRCVPIDISKVLQIINEMISNHHDDRENAQSV